MINLPHQNRLIDDVDAQLRGRKFKMQSRIEIVVWCFISAVAIGGCATGGTSRYQECLANATTTEEERACEHANEAEEEGGRGMSRNE